MVTMLINKTTKEIYMGKGDGTSDVGGEVVLSDVMQVNWMQTQDGKVVPVPSDYLHLVDQLVIESALPKEIEFQTEDYFVFDEPNIKKEMLDWYTKVLAKKSGIEIVGANSNIIV